MTPEELHGRVVGVVAEVLDRDPATIAAHASLIDDLGAESIDFLDIVFRLESAFDLKISSDEIWRGSLDPEDPQALALGLARLREAMPGFDWASFPEAPRKRDLPRLITVGTIVDYLRPRLG